MQFMKCLIIDKGLVKTLNIPNYYQLYVIKAAVTAVKIIMLGLFLKLVSAFYF